ncbi:toll-like receptor 4 [Saccostrea cucullata]|uniref:toll-like receptor 4 n=1 Tax=Saccostrea cuccullata TaxID=36930 RepID=UPI002ED45BF5
MTFSTNQKLDLDTSKIHFLAMFIIWMTMLISSVASTGQNCSSSKTCTCTPYAGKWFANCENLGLIIAPDFNIDIIGINLAKNKFTQVPQNLPRTLSYLDLSYNNLNRLDAISLRRYTFLRNFSISHNNLREIPVGTFLENLRMEYLDISNNIILTLEVIYNLTRDLQNSNIKYLNAEKLHCTYGVSHIIKVYHVVNLKHTSLEEFNLASNRIQTLETGVLTSLPKSLRVLNLADNMLSFGFYLMEFAVMRNLEVLNISLQNFSHQIRMSVDFFKNCNDTRSPPRVHVAGVNQNAIENYQSYKDTSYTYEMISVSQEFYSNFRWSQGTFDNFTLFIPPNLTSLFWHDCLYKLYIPKLPVDANNKMSKILMQRNIIYNLIGPVTGMKHVQYFDLSGNFCGYISKEFLRYFTGLKYLNLSNNALGPSFENDEFGEILAHQRKLLSLDLSLNRIGRLPRKVLKHNHRIKNLNISYNSLGSFNVWIEHMRRLSVLDLSHNQLSGLGPSTRKALNLISISKEIQVNILGNQLKCTCENLEFLNWIHKSTNLKFVEFENYTCAFGNSSSFSLKSLDIILSSLEKRCSSYTLIIVSMTSLIIVAMTLTVSRIVYRYRWKLRYMYYVAKQNYRGNTIVSNDASNKHSMYRFDAFVSYAESDRTEVINLVKSLEEAFDLKLCIHHRDFIPGTDIADNITNAIHSSRRTVCIMTSHFLNSYWCMFELKMAQMEAIYSRNGKNILILVVLEKSSMQKFPLHLMDLIESQSFLEYPQGEEEVIAFQSKLGKSLKAYE